MARPALTGRAEPANRLASLNGAMNGAKSKMQGTARQGFKKGRIIMRDFWIKIFVHGKVRHLCLSEIKSGHIRDAIR